MTVSLEAAAVRSSASARDVENVVFVEHDDDGSGQALEIQRPLRTDEQDGRLGLGISCVVRDAVAAQYAVSPRGG
jgi:hypothetical protein